MALRSLPMPGMAAAIRRRSGRRSAPRNATIVSAALRYARILNGFSPLISRRSPISAKTRAMRQVFHDASSSRHAGLDAASPPTRSGSRGARRRPRRSRGGPRARARARSRQNRQPPPPAPQTLPPYRAGIACGRQHARRSPAVVTPGARPLRFSHSSATCRPTSGQSPRSSASRMATAMSRMRAEALLDFAVPVDVPLGDLPVVDARVARGAGVGEHEPPLELVAPRPATGRGARRRRELDGGDAAVERRPIVLRRRSARRSPVPRRSSRSASGVPSARGCAAPGHQRAADGDVERRRARDAGANRRLGPRVQLERFRLEVVQQPSEQPQLVVVAQLAPVRDSTRRPVSPETIVRPRLVPRTGPSTARAG